MFDNETGLPIPKRFGQPGYEERRSKVPCELSIGCPKGHWKNRPDLTPDQKRVLELYRACRATGGRSLTDAESKDYFLTRCFGELAAIEQVCHLAQSEASTNKLIAILLSR